MKAPWESCTSPYSVVDDQRHKLPPRLALLFVHNGARRDGASD